MNIIGSIRKIISPRLLATTFLGLFVILLASPMQLQLQAKPAQKTTQGMKMVATPLVAHAQEVNPPPGLPICNEMTAFFRDPAKCMFFGIFWILLKISSWFVKLSGWILDIILSYTLSSITYNNQQGWITQGWALIRDFINIFFIALLLIIAGRMVMNIDGDSWKKQLVNVAVAALLINFSLFFTKVIVDGGNITARVFYRAMDLKPTDRLDSLSAGSAKQAQLDLPVEVRSLTAAVIERSNALNLMAQLGQGDAAMGTFSSDWVVAFLYVIIGVVMYVYMTYMFLNIAFYFFARTIGIWFYMIASPLAFLSAVKISWLQRFFNAPAMKEFGWDGYFSNLAKMAFQPAVFCFMMYLTIIAMNLFVFSTNNASFSFQAQTPEDFFINIVYWMVPLMVVFGIIIMSKKVTDKFSTAMGEFLASGVQSVVGTVGGLALGGTGRFLRSAVGARIAKGIGDKGEDLQTKALDNMATGQGSYLGNKAMLYKGKMLSKIKNRSEKGGWDIRDLESSLRGKFNKFTGLDVKTGMDLNSMKVGFKGLGYVDAGKIPVGAGYTLGTVFEEGRKDGGYKKHGTKVEEAIKKYGDEWLKIRSGQDADKIKKLKDDLEKAKNEAKDAEGSVTSVGFDGDERAAKQKLREWRKISKARDKFDGAYDKQNLEYFKDKSRYLINAYRLDKSKTTLSDVINGMSKAYLYEKAIFTAEQKRIEDEMTDSPEKTEKLDKIKKLLKDLDKEYSKQRGLLYSEFDTEIDRVTKIKSEEKPVIEATDSDEVKKEKTDKIKKIDAAQLEFERLQDNRDVIKDQGSYEDKEHIAKSGFDPMTRVDKEIAKQNNNKFKQRLDAYDNFQKYKANEPSVLKKQYEDFAKKIAEIDAVPVAGRTSEMIERKASFERGKKNIEDYIATKYTGSTVADFDTLITATKEGYEGKDGKGGIKGSRDAKQKELDDAIEKETEIEAERVKELYKDLEEKDLNVDRQADALKGMENGLREEKKDFTKRMNEYASAKKDKVVKTITTISGGITGGLAGAGLGALAIPAAPGIGALVGGGTAAPGIARVGYETEEARQEAMRKDGKKSTNIKLDEKKDDKKDDKDKKGDDKDKKDEDKDKGKGGDKKDDKKDGKK